MNKKRMGLGCFRPRREAASPPPAPEASHSLSFTFPATFNSNDAASSSSLVSPDDDEIDYGEIDDDTQRRPPRPSFGGPPLPLPLPPPTQRSSSSSALPALYDHCYPKQPRKELRRFSLEELSGACLNFSAKFLCRDGGPGAVYKASLLLSDSTSAKVDIATIPPNFSPKTERKWMAKLSLLALTQHPNLCRVLGYHFADGGGDKPASSSMVVYAAMPNGSLDGLLYGRSPDVAPLDWQSRLKIALGAAQGVAFLHQLSPAETVYGCFHTANVQVDRDFTARLSDYCFASRHHGGEGERSLRGARDFEDRRRFGEEQRMELWSGAAGTFVGAEEYGGVVCGE